MPADDHRPAAERGRPRRSTRQYTGLGLVFGAGAGVLAGALAVGGAVLVVGGAVLVVGVTAGTALGLMIGAVMDGRHQR